MAELADRQRAAGIQGRAFEEAVDAYLRFLGWTITDRHWRHPKIEVEIDFVAVDPDGEPWWIETKGSWQSTRNGLERTDTMKKALGSAAMVKLFLPADEQCRYMLITSHLAKAGTSGATWLANAEGVLFDAVRVLWLSDEKDVLS